MDRDGRLLTNEEEHERRWTEDFNEVLNRPDPHQGAKNPPAERELEIKTSPPKKADIKAAMTILGNNDAHRTASLCTEVFKTYTETAAETLH